MRLSLRGLWDGTPAPLGVGGEARVDRFGDALSLAWDVALPATPRVPEGAAGFLDGLWEYDVIELFLTASVAADPSPVYVEIEAGPAGHWLALAFSGGRQRAAELRDIHPRIESDLEGLRWRGRLDVELASLEPYLPADAALRGLAAFCTRDSEGERLYLCSQPLPGEQADFHRPSAWTKLTASRAPAP